MICLEQERVNQESIDNYYIEKAQNAEPGNPSDPWFSNRSFGTPVEFYESKIQNWQIGKTICLGIAGLSVGLLLFTFVKDLQKRGSEDDFGEPPSEHA